MAISTPLPNSQPEEKNNPGQEEFDKLIDSEYGSGHDTANFHKDRENLNNPDSKDNQPAGDISDPRVNQSEPGPEKSLYSPGSHQKSGFISRLNFSKNPKHYFLFGGAGASLIVLILLLFSFLNAFKIDGLMSNIEQRAFLRHNASLNTRSSKWISAYIEARMFQVGDNPNDNLLFRSQKVDTNSIFTDWYKTLRASNFEQQVFEKQGIKFTSFVDPNGKPRLGVININGEIPITKNISAQDFLNIQKGDVKTLNSYADFFNLEKLDSNKAGRRAIKKVVNNNTLFFQVYKRRSLRKAIQNMTGVRDWRFFETSRDKITDKRIDIRNRMLDKMLPDNNLLGQIARCFYGLSKCSPSRDTADPKVRETAAAIQAEDRADTNTKDQQANEQKLQAELDAAGISDSLKKVLQAANIFTRILNIPSTLDMLSYINGNIKNLVKLVVVARGAQAAGLFQVFETSRDQIKSGQVNAQEVNALMENVDTASSSAGWDKVVEGNGDPSVTQTGGQCSQEAQALQEKDPQQYTKKYGVYSPLCADQRIGNASNAQQIQDDYKATIGTIVGPIVGAWSGLKSSPLGPVINILEKLGNLISDAISKVVFGVLNILGLDDNVKGAIAWVFAKTSNFLGLTIIKGYESAGTIYNWLVQGGAYSAESATRQEGAALTTPDSQTASQKAVYQYQKGMKDESSLYDRVASLKNDQSLAYRGTFALSNLVSNPSGNIISGLNNVFSDVAKNFGTIFGRKLYAATPDGYTASKFAGIETYDYPSKCYDLDPITSQPIDGTNALEVFANPRAYGINHNPFPVSATDSQALNSWETETDSLSFYTTVYDVIGENTDNGDDIAVHIYNCNLLDTATRGSLGYLFGYTKDNADLVQ